MSQSALWKKQVSFTVPKSLCPVSTNTPVRILGSGVSPGDLVLGLCVKEGVGDAEIVVTAELLELSIFLQLPNSKVPCRIANS